MKFYLNSRKNMFNAVAEFDLENKSFIVLPGSKINSSFAKHVLGGKNSMRFRENKEYVNQDWIVIKPCVFTSPSTAAQFVTGTSRNGYIVWKNERGEYLKDIVKR